MTPSTSSNVSAVAPKVAITIPAFQAGPSVGDVVRRSLAILPDVLVIDDGSSDDTADQARAAGAEVISHDVNRGKGDALELAFETFFSRGFDAVVTVDADGQHLPEEIHKLLEAAGTGADEADLVLGTRDHLFTEMSRLRRNSNRLSSLAISLVAGKSLGDIQTGFRRYSRRLFETVGFPEARFEAESAVVVRAARHDLKIRSIPVKLGFADGRLTSHSRPLADSLRIAEAVTRARFEGRRKEARP